jgi:hypothetical protein
VNSLERLAKIWETLINFLVKYDSLRVSKLIDELKWEEVLHNPYVWLIGLPILGFLLIKKRFKILVFICSLAAFLYLLQITFPQSAQTIPLEKILRFIAGCVFLCILNLYFWFVRQD